MEPNFPSNFLFVDCVRFNSHENQQSQYKDRQSEPMIDEDDEALSLCDLAINDQEEDPPDRNPLEKIFTADQHQEDFDFGCAGLGFTENEMCSAADLFFRGHIRPLTGSAILLSTQTRNFTRSISYSSSGPVSVTSSRSSSTRSENSGTSGCSSTSGSEPTWYKSTTRNRNQFHSHPSPTPQIRTRSIRHTTSTISSRKWSLLQLGVLKPQEIGLEDLKSRSLRSHGSSRNSFIKDQDYEMEKTKHILSLGGCKCSADAIESTISSKSPMVKPKSTSLKNHDMKSAISKESNVGARKYAVTAHHRTYEWLKQLSIRDNSASL